MNNRFSYELSYFPLWFFVKSPLKIFEISKRLVLLLNNEISLTLNIKLIFTPIYGDYTKVGRVLGFIIRIIEIVLGLLVMVIVCTFVVVSPLLWLLAPIISLYFLKGWGIIYLLIVFSLHYIFVYKRPRYKISEVGNANKLWSFEPEVVTYLANTKKENKIPSKFFEHKRIKYLLNKLELNDEEFLSKVQSAPIYYNDLLNNSFSYAKDFNSTYVEIEHLFLALVLNLPKSNVVLATYGSSKNILEQLVLLITEELEDLNKIFVWQDNYTVPKMSGAGKGLTGRITPLLNSVSQDFTKMAQKGLFPKIVSHKDETNRVIDLIGNSKKTNVLIVGPSGCGKTALVKGLAQKVAFGTDANSIRFKRIVSIDTGALISGTKTAGDITKKIQDLMDEVKSSGDIVLFFDEIHNLVSGSTAQDGSTIFSLLEPHISDSNFQFIGATDIASYRKYIEPNTSFTRLFQLVELNPTPDDITLHILSMVARERELHEGYLISYPALTEIIKLSSKLVHDRVFPDKAVDILNRVCSEMNDGTKYITAEHVRDQISEITHVPVSSLSNDDAKKLLSIGDQLKKRIIGQDHAVSQIAKALQRARVGIRDESKPIAGFLFVGTTGVGKTETAKALAAEYFGDEKAMIRLDMSEYQQPDSLNRLIGDPNSNTGGILTDAVRSKPFSLILLDEIEKAYSNILLTFLQVLDDGRLTDSNGLTVDFSNSIIIATSNVGTKAIQKVAKEGGSIEEMSKIAMNEVREHYAPEFLNRFTGIIVFKPLEEDTIRSIVDLMLNKIRKIGEEKGIKIDFANELYDELMERGYDKDWGARSMGRVIEDTVETYLAQKLLKGDIKMGDQVTLGKEVFLD